MGILFDFDGVLVNSEPLHFYAHHEVLRHEKIDLTEEEYYSELIGFDDKGAFRYIYQKRQRELDPRTFLRLMTRKSEIIMEFIHQRKIAALPGAAELVRGLWRDYPLAVVSGGVREEIEAMLEGIALRDCFKFIISAEDVTVGKPDPSCYLLAVEQLGQKMKRSLKPADVLVVEDAPNVITEARKAGFPVLGVASTRPPEKLSAANWVVPSLQPREVLSVLPKLKFLES